MLLAEVRDMVAEGAKDVKEKACRRRPTDISNTVDAFRGGDPVATIILKHTPNSRRDFIEAFYRAATGYEADQIAVMTESYTSGPALDPVTINPLTGEEIDNTTLSDLFLNRDGAAKGWVRECLFVQVYNRAGDLSAARLPYHFVGGAHLVWDEPERLPEDLLEPGEEFDPGALRATGSLADPLAAVMTNLPGFSQVFPGIVTEEKTRAELDVLVTAAIQLRVPCSVMLWAHQGGEREETIRKWMERR